MWAYIITTMIRERLMFMAYRVALSAVVSILQAVFLYLALLTLTGIIPIPAEWSIVFAIIGVACLAGAIATGSRVKFSASPAKKKTAELILPSLEIQPSAQHTPREQAAFGHTEYMFDGTTPDGTEFIATEMKLRRQLRLSWNENGIEKAAEVSGFPFYIGRDAAFCTAAINDTSVSRKHAQISYSGGVFSVSDAGSSNGTLLDGLLVASDKEIHTGQVIRVGRVSIRVEVLE